MDSFLKLNSIKKDNQNCNCIKPFYLNEISGKNPITKREYSREDRDSMKIALYRISNAKGCELNVCCDINDPTTAPDSKFIKNFIKKYPKIMPIYKRNVITSIKLSTEDIIDDDWSIPTSYMICKITKSEIKETEDPTIYIADNLVNDCFTNQ